jgi:hypothetical protein
MSLPPNWNPRWDRARPMHYIPCGPDRARASEPAMVPQSGALDWTPCPLDFVSHDVCPRAVGCPFPEPHANWDWSLARARSH